MAKKQKRKERRAARRRERLEMLEAKLDRALALGVIDADEARAIRDQAAGFDYAGLLQLILMVIEMIVNWFKNRRA